VQHFNLDSMNQGVWVTKINGGALQCDR
jgi:hypothetical protein